MILWRSSSQWIGGLYFLFSILLLIDIFDDNLKKTLTNFLAFNSSEIFKQFFKIFIFYLFLTFIIFIIFNIFDFRSFTSLNLSFTVISSGGFLPVNNLFSIASGPIKISVLSLTMLISFCSLFFIYNLFFIKEKGVKSIQEDLYLLIYLLIIFSIFFVFLNKNLDFKIFLLAISSSVSNIGLSLNIDQPNLYFIFLLLVIIGGSFFSTSSGLRFLKIYSLTKYSLNQILSFSRPKNVFMNKLLLSNINFDNKDINKYFLTVIVFILSLFTLMILLSLSDISFTNSFKLSVLTLMNTVNSSAYGISEFDFSNLHFLTKYFLIFFMIIGRVELITLLLVAKKFLFKN